MVQRCEVPQIDPLTRRAPQVSYGVGTVEAALAEAGTLAVFGFGEGAPHRDDPRYLRVPLEGLDGATPLERWQIDAPVSSGRDGALQWSAGGGWLFAAIELDEAQHGGAAATAQLGYERLHQLVAARPERHVMRIWNYLGAINHGHGDAEHYKHFCDGRGAGMGNFFADGFPAATAIGHLGEPQRLQIYLLACDQPGQRVENPRQVSAWCYPRQYGRTPPSFARAMSLPAGDALAISGTAAVVGHSSAHQDDLDAQLVETMRNLEALLTQAGIDGGLDTHSPMKAYVRHRDDAVHVRQFLDTNLPGVPVLLLHGDICRSELLFEIDGWRYA